MRFSLDKVWGLLGDPARLVAGDESVEYAFRLTNRRQLDTRDKPFWLLADHLNDFLVSLLLRFCGNVDTVRKSYGVESHIGLGGELAASRKADSLSLEIPCSSSTSQ